MRRSAGAVLALSVVHCGPPEQLAMDMAAMREELAAQRRQQAALLNRIERLEGRESVRQVHAPLEARVELLEVDPMDGLPVVRLEPGPANPAALAPPLDTRVPVREPTAAQWAMLQKEPAVNLDARLERTDPKVDKAFAEGVRLYNSGERLKAAELLEALANEHPRHEVADNALYLSGLARMIHGDCRGARPRLERVLVTASDADAAAPAMLALGQCALNDGNTNSAREWFERVLKEHPRTPESTQAEAALADLRRTTSAELRP